MDTKEFLKNLEDIVKHPYDNEKIADSLFDEWCGQKLRVSELEARIAELEVQVERLRWHYLYEGELPERGKDVIYAIGLTKYFGIMKDDAFRPYLRDDGFEFGFGVPISAVSCWRYVD